MSNKSSPVRKQITDFFVSSPTSPLPLAPSSSSSISSSSTATSSSSSSLSNSSSSSSSSPTNVVSKPELAPVKKKRSMELASPLPAKRSKKPLSKKSSKIEKARKPSWRPLPKLFLPREISNHVLSFCSLEDEGELAVCSKDWHELILQYPREKLHWSSKGSLTISTIATRAHCLTDLDLTDSPFRTLGSLPSLPRLRSLNFSGCVHLSSIDFAQVAKRAPNLETFYCDLTRKHGLCKDIKLTRGYINSITKHGTNLSSLSLTIGSKMKYSDLSSLEMLKNLHSLGLFMEGFSFIDIPRSSSLKRLSITRGAWHSRSWANFCSQVARNCPALEVIAFYDLSSSVGAAGISEADVQPLLDRTCLPALTTVRVFVRSAGLFAEDESGCDARIDIVAHNSARVSVCHKSPLTCL